MPRVCRVCHPQRAGRSWHQLHHTHRPAGGHSIRIKIGFCLCHRLEQLHRHASLLGGCLKHGIHPSAACCLRHGLAKLALGRLRRPLAAMGGSSSIPSIFNTFTRLSAIHISYLFQYSTRSTVQTSPSQSCQRNRVKAEAKVKARCTEDGLCTTKIVGGRFGLSFPTIKKSLARFGHARLSNVKSPLQQSFLLPPQEFYLQMP